MNASTSGAVTPTVVPSAWRCAARAYARSAMLAASLANSFGFIALSLEGDQAAVQAACEGRKLGCTTAPPRVSMTPLMMSSVSGNFGAFASLSQNVLRKVSRLRAYRDEAATGMRPGQLW